MYPLNQNAQDSIWNWDSSGQLTVFPNSPRGYFENPTIKIIIQKARKFSQKFNSCAEKKRIDKSFRSRSWKIRSYFWNIVVRKYSYVRSLSVHANYHDRINGYFTKPTDLLRAIISRSFQYKFGNQFWLLLWLLLGLRVKEFHRKWSETLYCNNPEADSARAFCSGMKIIQTFRRILNSAVGGSRPPPPDPA